MARLVRAAVAGLALAAPLAVVPAARAATGTMTVDGSGAINPGLPCPPSGCAIHVDLTAVFAGQLATGFSACTFDGSDTYPGGATVVAGAGRGTVNCAGDETAGGTLSFVRSGTYLRVYGCLVVNGSYVVVDLHGSFTPKTTPPVTAFAVDATTTYSLGCIP